MQRNNGTALLDATRRGSFQEVTEILERFGNPDFCDETTGEAALHLAITNNPDPISQLLIVNKLLEAGASIDRANVLTGKTPLYLAVETNNEDIARLLLNRKASANKIAKDSTSPLSIAIFNNRLAMVALLIDHGAILDMELYRELAKLCQHNLDKKPYIKTLKKKLFTAINEPNSREAINRKISLCEDALNPFKALGEIMHIKCGPRACSIKRGTLLDIHSTLLCAREYRDAMHDFDHAPNAPTSEDLETAIKQKNLGKVEFLLTTNDDLITNNAFFLAATSGHVGIMKEFIKVYLQNENFSRLNDFILSAKNRCRGCAPSKRKMASQLSNSVKMIKDEIIAQIKASDGEEKTQKATAAYDRTTDVGRIIYIQRKQTTCKEGHGSLKIIKEILDSARAATPLRALSFLARPYEAASNRVDASHGMERVAL
jgi:ankyrin repeat protein